MKLKYGKEEIQLPIQDKNIIQILNSNRQKALLHPENRLKELLKNPINCSSLKDLVTQKGAEKVLVIVNDITRPTPYDVILPPLLEELHYIGIRKENIIFIIATGSHRGNSKEEIIEIFGEDIASCYKFMNHDDQKSQMKDFGQLKSGNRLLVNSIVSEVDFVITTGVIVPHYFAGFSGGRKSILPGICGRKTIEANHSNMIHPDTRAGNLKGNPVHEEMQEAAEKVGVDFNINVVTDENHQIIEIVAGELYTSWQQGVEVCKKTYLCPIKRKAEVVITSTGGYPKDINVYQAQKALENAYQAIKPGGTIILLAECPEGYGQATFERWIEEASSIDDIINRLKKKFVLGGHKAFSIARVAKEVEVLLISSLPQDKVHKLFFIPMENITRALNYVREKHGEDFKAYILPLGNTVVPQVY
ncbi:MAG: nickel-dependent lactate racemase [Candidatus Caldatribacteriota bacterium]|nr:nickel-dependent lactate racemase [Candidatus Caldatribacteriota bacterium]